MKPITGERVHIVSLTFDANLIAVPLKQIGCERIYTFVESSDLIANRWRSELALEVNRKFITNQTVIESRRDLPTLYDQLEKIVSEETHAGNSVFINVSSGTRVFTAAAALISAKYSVELYYVHSTSYHIKRNFSSGVEKVELLNQTATIPSDIEIDSTLAFVAMPFLPDLNAIYEDIIGPSLRELTLRAVRADQIFDNRQIMDDIWDNIERARLVIADLTGKNANVFYETGVAHALGKEVILITQSLDDVPFDLRPLRCIVYSNTLRGAEQLKTQLIKTVETVLTRTSKKTLTRQLTNSV
ncbi:MAG: DUF6293 family protein [Verrucomicrobia bacterium]|nr:DUF6293 family protein [Verrucomicrobiota bacterium]